MRKWISRFWQRSAPPESGILSPRLPDKGSRALWLWIVPLLFLGLFFFYPIAIIFRLAFQAAILNGVQADLLDSVWQPLSFTIWQAVLSTLLTLLLGLPAAYVFARYSFPGKSLLRILTTLPFILPTVVVAAAFNALLGPNGWVNILLVRLFNLAAPPVQLMNSLAIILLAHVFYNTTVIIRVVGSAWSQLDPRLEMAGRALGASPWRVLWEITLPLLRPAIQAATLLVFLFDFTSFGVVLLLGGPYYATLEVEIYIQTLQLLNLPLAGLLSAIQLICTILIMSAYSRLARGQNVPLVPRLQGEGTKKLRTFRERLLISVIIIFIIALLVLPMAALVTNSVTRLEANRGERATVTPGLTLDYYRELFINRRQSIFYVPPIAAAGNSLVYALITVGISLSLGFLAAYGLIQKSWLNRLLDPLLMLPLGTSAVTLGLGFIVVFTHPPLDVRSFPWIVPIAHSLVALPFVVRTLTPAISAIPQNLRQAAAVLGASPRRVWLEVDWPIVSRAALVAAIFAFTISIGEFGATSFLARPETPTMPIAIARFLSQPGALNYGQALAMATLLMLVCGAGIFALERLE